MLKKITVEKVILFLAAGFAAYNFGLAGGFIEGQVFSVGGLIAGVVVNVSLAVAASRYGSITGAKRTKQAQAAFWAMLIISPSLVAPVIYYSLPVTFLAFAHADVWWLNILSSLPRIVWSLAWPAGADLAIVLAGAVSGKGLIALSDASTSLSTQSEASAEGSASSAQGVRPHKKGSASAVRSECAALSAQYACTEAQCGWSPSVDALMEAARAGKNPKSAASSAKAGHAKNNHPKKPLAVGLFAEAVSKTEKAQ